MPLQIGVAASAWAAAIVGRATSLSGSTTVVGMSFLAILKRRRGDLKDLETRVSGPLHDHCARSPWLVLVGLGSGEWHRRGGDGAVIGCSVGQRLGHAGDHSEDDLRLGIWLASFSGGMLHFPACAADRTADPFRRRRRGQAVAEGDVVPGNEGIIALDPDAGVGADLGLEDAGCGAGTLGKRASTFLQKIKSVEGYLRVV